MRRLVFGLLTAVLLYWAWSSVRGGAEAGGPEDQPRTDLAAMLANAPANPVGQPAASGDDADPPAVERPADPELERAFSSLIAAIERGDAEARSQAIRLLGRDDLRPDHRERLSRLLSGEAGGEGGAAPGSGGAADGNGGSGDGAAAPARGQFDVAGLDDAGAILERLGTNNDFLHAATGRQAGARLLELMRGLSDAEAVTTGTGLLERCMRGRITRDDKEAIAFVDRAYKEHRVRADRYLCDPANLTRARSYEIKQGDSLGAIANRFRREGIAIEAETLAVLNRIHNVNAIRVGQRIRCPVDPVHAVLEKRSFLMAVYLGDQILRLYWVGHGADGKTPVTEFTVSEKLKDPDWYSPAGPVYPAGSPENILGRYFIKFDHPSYSGFGAHGTPQPETVGTMSSMGCIRMYDDDIAELYRLLPRKAAVAVRDSN